MKAPPPPVYYRIGDIVQHTGLSRQTIHNYSAQGLICESARTPGGHRLYGPEVFARLHVIASLKQTMTMGEIHQYLAAQGDDN